MKEKIYLNKLGITSLFSYKNFWDSNLQSEKYEEDGVARRS